MTMPESTDNRTTQVIEAPLFTVVIPARNAARFIAATLQSLRDQTEGRFEAIVLDDGSTDATARLVGAQIDGWGDRRFRLIDGPAQGVSAARNAGLGQARAATVLFLDADDLLAPDALARFRATREKAADAVAVLGRIAKISEDGTPVATQNNLDLLPENDQLVALLQKNFIPNGGALAIDTAAARAVGGFEQGLRYGEDWEFWCRLALQGRLAPVAGGPVLLYRQVASGANVQARGSDLVLAVACIDRVAANPAMRARFGARLDRLLRARRIDIFWSGVRSTFQHGSRARALRTAVVGALIYPDSLFRPRLALRFLRTLRGS